MLNSEPTTLFARNFGLTDPEIACRWRDVRDRNLAANPANDRRHVCVKPGSLFSALQGMEEGWISSFWSDSKTNRHAKYYRLSKAGLRQLEIETKRWAMAQGLLAQRLQTGFFAERGFKEFTITEQPHLVFHYQFFPLVLLDRSIRDFLSPRLRNKAMLRKLSCRQSRTALKFGNKSHASTHSPYHKCHQIRRPLGWKVAPLLVGEA